MQGDAARSTLGSVLVVEDDPEMAAFLAETLQGGGYRVELAHSGTDALLQARLDPLRAIFLDLSLPDADGLLLIQDLQRVSNAPVLICSGTGRQRDRTVALRLGAEDYLAKPVDPDELLARLEAVLRRFTQARTGEVSQKRDALEYAGLRLFPRTGEASVGDVSVSLAPTESRLLQVLLGRRGAVVSSQGLVSLLGASPRVQDGRALDLRVKRLRTKLARMPGAPLLDGTRARGYSLIPDSSNAQLQVHGTSGADTH